MIFATVGTHHDGFPRMLEALALLGDGEELDVQFGNGAAPPNATSAQAFYSFGEMTERFARARVVVTHAGVGSILLATRAGHVPIVVPRLRERGEHVDDHQVELARALEAEGRVVVCWEAERLPELVAAAAPRRAQGDPAGLALAEQVGRAIRGERIVDAPLASSLQRPDPGILGRIVNDTLGAYFGFGRGFRPQEAGRRVNPRKLAGYYCDFSHKAAPEEREPGSWLASVLAGGPWTSPMMVAQAALGLWERRLAGEDADEPFLALADWLVREGVAAGPSGEAIGWRHDFAAPKYGLLPGWLSGMTQGEAISVLLRAHALSGDERYLDVARRAFELFRVDVADGGVVRELDGALVIEEYPTESPTAVLNGWIFGFIGLHELSLVDDRREVAETRARVRAGLLRLLPRYDAGWWSRYSLAEYGGRADLAKPFYQRLHVVLVDALHLIEPDPLLHDTARRWEAQLTRMGMARIAVDKVSFRVHRALRR